MSDSPLFSSTRPEPPSALRPSEPKAAAPAEAGLSLEAQAAQSAGRAAWSALWSQSGPFDLDRREGPDALPLACRAALAGNAEGLEFILTRGADPRARSRSGQGLLRSAALGGDERCFELALALCRDQAGDLCPSGLSLMEACLSMGNHAAARRLSELPEAPWRLPARARSPEGARLASRAPERSNDSERF